MKTKIFLVLLTFFLIPSFSFAGDKDSSKTKRYASININGGFGIPFKSSEGMFESYGQNGSSINLNTTIPIKHSNLGITAMIGYGSNPFAVGNYIDNEIRTTEFSSYNENLTEYTAMAGISLTIPYHRFLFDFRLLGGAVYFKVPGNEYSSSTYQVLPVMPTEILYYITNVTVNQNSNTSPSLEVGISVKFRATKRIFVSLNFNYFYAHPNIDDITIVQSGTNWGPSLNYFPLTINTANYNNTFKDIQLINLTFGLDFMLGKQ
jgi:hypothetical protein